MVSLVNKGLIEKLQNQHDARTYDLFLTAKGKLVYEEVVALITHRNTLAMKTLSVDEQDTLLRLIGKIQQNLENN